MYVFNSVILSAILLLLLLLFQYMGGGPEPPLPLGAQEAPLVMNGEA